MTKRGILAVGIALSAAGTFGAATLVTTRGNDAAVSPGPVWTETPWPLPPDPWGKGKAYHCPAEHCGAEVKVYVRAKLGLCGCVTAIDDDDVDRVADVDLIGTVRRIDPGRSIELRWAKGRIRGYVLDTHGGKPNSALTIALHERCDMIVATSVGSDAELLTHERVTLEFLDSDKVVRWAETALGL
jgi:hypothetical protein